MFLFSFISRYFFDFLLDFFSDSFVTLEKAMAPLSSTLAWEIPWTEEPGRLQSMGSQRVRHDWATSLSLFTFMHWRRQWQPTPVFLENPRDRGACWAAVYGFAQSQTRLMRLSSSRNSPTLCDPMDCSPPASSVHGISQAVILEWVVISFSRGSSWGRDQILVSCNSRQILYHCATWEALSLLQE